MSLLEKNLGFPVRSSSVDLGDVWYVPFSLVDVLATTYTNIDVAHELRKAHAWCVSNPKRRKTIRGMPRFLNRWMDQASMNPTPQTDDDFDKRVKEIQDGIDS